MEFVPFEFCASVCAFLTNLGNLDVICRANRNCDFWNAAIEMDFEKRQKITLSVGYSTIVGGIGIWTYCIDNSPNLTFESCQAVVKNFRFERITFRRHLYFNRSDLKTICKFGSSCIYKTDLDIPQDFQDLKNVHATIFGSYEGLSFRDINIHCGRHKLLKPAEDFLIVQLNSHHLKELTLTGKVSAASCLKIQELVLRGTFHNMEFPRANFDLKFFKKLFNKQLNGAKEFSFSAQSLCGRRAICNFQKNCLITFGTSQATWRRKDGVVATAEWCDQSGKVYSLKFTQD